MDSRPPSQSPPARGGGQRGVTLIEMVAVVAVLAIIMAVTMPAVTSLSKSSSRRAAVTLTLSTLDQARALALSRGGIHYLVLADLNAAWPEEYRCRAFAIFQEVYNPAASRYDRFPVTAWTLLPTGVAFKPDADTVFAGAREVFYCKPAGGDLAMPCFKFSSVGTLEEPTDTNLARLRLFEGFFNGLQPVATNRAGAAGEEVLRISLVTGRAKREES
jgi:prepilin-type N-terminal cleavage/methylation domain-containing protein